MFRGLPYAAPPLGARRFRPPQPPAAWAGVRPATEFGPAASQNPPMARFLSLLGGMSAAHQSEDCLYLNIWTPDTPGTRRPVMVWIHGGGFAIGTGATRLYAGGRMARRGDVVVVTLNYRLGALGYLNLHAMDDRLEANFGLRDQIAALEWVRDNIEQFGGDPENVTVFGESAGGMSVGTLLGTPAASGLFHRAIAQSGAASNVTTAAVAATVAERLLRHLGEPRVDVEALRRRSVGEILAAQMQVALEGSLEIGILPWQPSLDSDLLPAMPLEAIAAGSARSVPLIVGSNRDEWRVFMLADAKGRRLDDAGLRRRLERSLAAMTDPASAGDLIDSALALYGGNGGGVVRRPSDGWVAFQGDRVFHRPAQQLAATHGAAGAPAYAYLFTWSLPLVGSWLGAFHGIEIPFVFGTVRDGMLGRALALQPSARQLSDAMQNAWIAFAHSGEPSTPELPEWHPFDPQRRPVMHFGSRVTLETGCFDDRLPFWERLGATSPHMQTG